MEEPFDPYYKWLGIPPHEQPPNHYRLLGINAFESDPDVISAAADRQMGHIRTYQTGPHAGASQRILNEVAAARVCLLDAGSRSAYNHELRAKFSAEGGAIQAGNLLAENLRGATRYAILELERLWVLRLRLPAAYLALGRDVVREGRFLEELSGQYARLDEIVRRHRSLRPAAGGDRAKTESTAGQGTSYWGLMHDSVRTVRLWFGIAVFHYRHRAALRGMGRAAYAAHQAESGPEHLAGQVQTLKARLDQLQTSLERLSTVPEGHYLSPQRAAWLLLAILLLPVLLLLWLF
ncbi:MAG: hypothetical protein HUU20_08010 [Pirellulales bacterium]|nr:hypothetical protein [Pirellulales bacterium]